MGGITHKLDGDLLVVEEIRTLENDTKGALSDLLPYTVMHTNNVGRRRSHCLLFRDSFKSRCRR